MGLLWSGVRLAGRAAKAGAKAGAKAQQAKQATAAAAPKPPPPPDPEVLSEADSLRTELRLRAIMKANGVDNRNRVGYRRQ